MTMRSGPVTAWVAGETGPLVLTSTWGWLDEPRTATLRTVRFWALRAGARPRHKAAVASFQRFELRYNACMVCPVLKDFSSVTRQVTHSVEHLKYTKGHGRFRGILAAGACPT